MSWRDSLWAAAAVASTLKDQAQSTLTSAAAQVQQSYHEATNGTTAAYSTVGQHDADAHNKATNATHDSQQHDGNVTDSSSLTSIAASFPSLTSISSSLPASLGSLTLPTALSRLSALTDAAPPNNTAPAQVDSDAEQSEQLIPADGMTQTVSLNDGDVAVLTLDADEVELPSLVVNKTSLQTPVKPTHVNDSDEAPSLYYTPQQHKAKQQRDQLLTNGNHTHQPTISPSPDADAYLTHKHHSTAQLFQQQDNVLHSMSSSIARLSELSSDIGGELSQHQAMLDEVGEEMEVGEGLMDTSRKKIARLLEGAPRYHLYVIGVMCVIVVVLLYFILYT